MLNRYPPTLFSAKGYRAPQGWVNHKTVSIFLRWQEKKNVIKINLRFLKKICYQQNAVKKKKKRKEKEKGQNGEHSQSK